MQRIKKAYAENGDLRIIPEIPPLDGSENWEQGRGANFELDNDPNTGDPLALDIDREQDNYFKNVISNNIKHWQENTYPSWFDDIEYPKNATVKYTDGNIYASKVDNNTALPTDAINWTIFDPSSLKVALADFTGANVSLAGNGYQKLPSGLIIQWGEIPLSTPDNTNVNLPIAFPNQIFKVTAVPIGTIDTTQSTSCYWDRISSTLSSIRIPRRYANNGGDVGVAGQGASYIAIGY